MNTRVLTYPFQGFSRTGRKKSFVAVIVVACLFINSLIPRFVIQKEDYRTLKQIMVNQSAVIQMFSLPTLSVKIMKCIFMGEPWTPTQNNRDASRHDSRTAVPLPDSTIINIDNRTNTNRCQYYQRWTDAFQRLPVFVERALFSRSMVVHRVRFAAGIILLLMFPLLLARSNTDGDAAAQLQSTSRPYSSPA